MPGFELPKLKSSWATSISNSEGEAELSDDELSGEVFDIDKFKSGSKFDQEAAEKAYHEWMQRRRQRKVPLSFVQDTADEPKIRSKEFKSLQNKLNLTLVENYRKGIAELKEYLADPDLQPSERRKLDRQLTNDEQRLAEIQASLE